MKRITVTLVFYVLLIHSGLSAYHETIDVRSDSDNTQVVHIPFRYVDHQLMIVQGRINDVSGYILVDIGIESLVLNQRFFKGRGRAQIQGIGGNTSKARLCTATVQIGSVQKHVSEAYVIDIEAHLWNKGTPIIGFVGWKFFQSFDLMIDLKRQLLSLYPQEVPGPLDAPLFSLPFQWNGPIPFITLDIAGKKYRFSIDTGAESNVLNQRVFRKNALQHKITGSKEIIGFGNKKVVPRVEILNLSEDHILRVENFLIVSLDPLNGSLPGPRIDGVLGGQFLKGFSKVSISFPGQSISFWTEESVLVNN